MDAIKYILVSLLVGATFAGPLLDRGVGEEPYQVPDSQYLSIPLTPPDEAAAAFTAPAGFTVTVFAAEPEVRQPIAIATDTRGRLWVAENYTYAESRPASNQQLNDRILCFADANHDGKADRRIVFWDKATNLTSVEIGFGGVWAMCPPRLLFLPDRDHDDRPDGEPVVMLDGFEVGSGNRHNFANGLKWGPDGWLYGRNGISHVGHIGVPNSPSDQRTTVGPGIWRFHPVTHRCEVVVTGTTNPWGHDWDEHGELFFINTVIGHLWHAVPGAHFKRMFGADPNPFVYDLLDQTADHFHWDTRKEWNDVGQRESNTTDQAGGGHAHSGLMIYLGDNWPDEYRNQFFTLNLHGRRVNRDLIERHGAGYVGQHGADCFQTTDPWFRGIDLHSGPDGTVYVADWSDIGECHEADGVHRNSGRIFRFAYRQPRQISPFDLSRQSDAELVKFQEHRNDWFARKARQVLHECAAAGGDMSKVHATSLRVFQASDEATRKLQALWTLQDTSGLSESWLLDRLHDERDEHVRSWIVRLLTENHAASVATQSALAKLAARDTSGLVLLYLSSALQRLEIADRFTLARSLLGRDEFADDPVLPLMIWYGIEPFVARYADRAVSLAVDARVPICRRYIARRITHEIDSQPEPINQLVRAIADCPSEAVRLDLLKGMLEAFEGIHRSTQSESWAEVQRRLTREGSQEVQLLALKIAVVFGDKAAIADLSNRALSAQLEIDVRRSAIRSLTNSRADEVVPLLQKLLTDPLVAVDAVRSLAAFDDPTTAGLIIKNFAAMPQPAREAAVETLTSRSHFAYVLLDAIADGTVKRQDVTAFQVRQMQGLADEHVRALVAKTWPELRPIADDRKSTITKWRSILEDDVLAKADRTAGRAVWNGSCAKCHTLFGEGGKIGPDLTGAQRTNLDYLLENIIDPSASLVPGFRISTIQLVDGRVINGVVLSKTDRTWEIQTATDRMALAVTDIEEHRETGQSLMPDGLLDLLNQQQVRDLIAFLMTPSQVALPDN